MKKLVVMVLVFVLILGTVGCTSENGSQKVTEGSNGVLAEVNGKKITREMASEQLKEAEKQAAISYVNQYLLDEFYKDITVNEVEVQAQLALIKGQVGEEQWDMYLNYMGYPDDETYVRDLELNLKKSKKKDTVKSEVQVTEEEIKTRYEASPDEFNIVVGDMVFFDTEEAYNLAKDELLKEGSTLESISEVTKSEIRQNEHVTFGFDGFTKPITELEVDDLVSTTAESNVFAVIKVTKTYEVLREEVKAIIEDEKADEIVEKQLEEHYNKAEVTILGEKFK